MSNYVDFETVKEKISMTDAIERLGLDMKASGKQLRGKCPACEGAGDRSLVVTPHKGVFYCFSEKKGGDQIQLVAHVNGCSVKEAAQFLVGTVPKEKYKKEGQERGFQPLTYLVHDHPAVEALGFEPEVAEALGIGFAPRGILRGTVACPVRNPDGSISAYIGLTEIEKMPPKWEL